MHDLDRIYNNKNKNMNKKIASEIAIGVILLLAIVIGGIFWLQNKKEMSVVQPVVIQPVQQTPITQPVDEIANWQTYANDTFGFSFKYPKGLRKGCVGNDLSYCDGKNGVDGTIDKITGNISDPVLSFTTRLGDEFDKTYNSLNEYIAANENSVQGLDLTQEAIKFGDNTCTHIYGVALKSKNQDIFERYVIVLNNGQVLAFQLEKAEYKDTLEKILSSFKFTDSVVDETAMLKSIVSNAVDVLTVANKMSWDKKIDNISFDSSKKAAKGSWWAVDARPWIAWKQDNGQWSVFVDFEGASATKDECKFLKNVPIEYETFFHGIIDDPIINSCLRK